MEFPSYPALQMHPKYLVAGPLQRDFVIQSDGRSRLDFMGGAGVFAAAGMAIWDGPIGLLCRVGEDYPREWLHDLSRWQIDTRGVKILPELVDLRAFYGYTSPDDYETSNPVKHFAHHTIPFPSILLNYKPTRDNNVEINRILPSSPRSTDIPREYLDATAAHLCPMDYLTQSLLQPVLRSGTVKTISLEAHPSYMQPEYWNKLPAIVSGLTAFIVDENALRLFFRNRTTDLMEMADTVAKMGCEVVIIHQPDGTKIAVEFATSKRWLIPVYPVDRKNVHSSKAAFGGGLLAGYQKTYDPLEAVIHGVVTESIAAEGFHPTYLFDTLSGLAEARLGVLRETVRVL